MTQCYDKEYAYLKLFQYSICFKKHTDLTDRTGAMLKHLVESIVP